MSLERDCVWAEEDYVTRNSCNVFGKKELLIREGGICLLLLKWFFL